MFQFQHIFAYEILKENFDKTFIITKNTKISTIGEESSERFMLMDANMDPYKQKLP